MNQSNIQSLSQPDELTGHLIDFMIWLVGHLFVPRLSLPLHLQKERLAPFAVSCRAWRRAGACWQGGQSQGQSRVRDACHYALAPCSLPTPESTPWQGMSACWCPMLSLLQPGWVTVARLWRFSFTSLEGFPLHTVDVGLWQDFDRLGQFHSICIDWDSVCCNSMTDWL